MGYIGFEWHRRDSRALAWAHRDWRWWLATWLPYALYRRYLDASIKRSMARLKRKMASDAGYGCIAPGTKVTVPAKVFHWNKRA